MYVHVEKNMKIHTITLWSVLITQILDYNCFMIFLPYTYPDTGIILYGNPQLDKNI